MKITKIITIALFLSAAAFLSSCEEGGDGETSSVPQQTSAPGLVAMAKS
tara:strand:- start:3881 stop:4027 length:147 start_codon:yes stop_codon:yes gene_type:complete